MSRNKEDLNLKWFKNFAKICDKNNIWYSVYAGTMLGAVRHNGRIPWDDDYDVMMKPDGYEKLKNLFPQHCLDTFSMKGYPYLFPKFVPNFEQLFNAAIFVDIFVVVPTTLKKMKQFVFWPRIIQYFITRIHSISKKWDKNIVKYITWPFKFLVKKTSYKWAVNILESKNNYDFYYPIDINLYIIKRIIINKNCKLKIQKIKFEDFEVNILSNYHEYLTSMFGDYMTPIKYKQHHSNVIDMS